MKKSIAIIQSNYIPWKGYFDLIKQVDEVILFDDVQYTANDWRNRNIIKTKNGLRWLTVPVKNNFGQKIKDVVVSYAKWNHKHWKSITHSYNKAPFFHDYGKIFEELYLDLDEVFLSRINYRFLCKICEIFAIPTKISWSMDYNLIAGKTERLIDLCKQAGADEYLSGPNAKGYINQSLFKEEGIKLSYMEYSHYPEYNQLFPPFKHEVSVIDLIFNEGPNATKYMKGC